MKPIQALLALFAFAFLPLHAASLADLTYTTTDGKVTITDCATAATGELVIPDTIGGKPVTSIGDDAFRGCSSLTSITIPDGVTSIGAYTFFDCTSLTNIIFQGDAPSVGFKAFVRVANGAVALVTIEALSSFGASGDDWNGLTVEPILTWTTTDGEVTITDCNEAAAGELTIPDTIEGKSVTSIGEYAFQGCTSLTNITIPDGVTTIGSVAFVGCTSLTSITIPDSVTSIAIFAFWNCTSLTSITIPDSVTLIAGGTFQNCSSLTSITIPDQVTSISYDAFNGCQSLTSITIPDSVTSIERYAFYSCSALSSITFMGAAPTVGSEAFTNTPDGAVAYALRSTSFGASGDDWNGLTVDTILKWTTTNGKVTITDCDEAATGELVIPATIGGNPVTSIGIGAFDFCTSLTSVTIPDSVTSIGNAAFCKCTRLTSITIPDGVTSIGREAFFACTRLTSITIPNGVTSIGNAAFRECSSLTSITIPDSVTSIGIVAFFNCRTLTSITIGNGVTSIGEKAFRYCTSLTSITIPDSVTSIGDYAFNDCTSLTSITFEGAPPTMGRLAFSNTPDGAAALVTIEDQTSFGDLGADWNGLTVSMSVSDMITALNAQNAAVATARTAGQGDVTSTPASYNLTTTESYNAVVTQRDARFVDTDKDGITDVKEAELETDSAEETIFYLQEAYDSAVAASRLSGQGDVTADPATFALTTLAAYNGMVAQKDITITTLNTTVGANIVEIDELKELIETRNNTISSNTTTIESLNETITQKEAAYVTVVAERDARPTQVAYDAALATARTAGQGDVTNDPASYNLTTTESYNTVVAERDARPTQTSYNTVVAERDARPTQAALTEAITQRDARFTEEQINAMTVDPTVGRNAAGNMQVDISFIHSTDLETFTPFALSPDWVSVVDGKITLEFPPNDDDTFFYRLGVQ